jgi:ABC-type sulfate transport system permease component
MMWARGISEFGAVIVLTCKLSPFFTGETFAERDIFPETANTG